jgi:hypothetical protein
MATRDLADELGGAVQAARVDVEDPESLLRFCRGCRIVVNCAGPSFSLLDRAARGALAAEADYIDLGGDEPVYQRLAGLDIKRRVVLLTAGMMPGLSALAIRWLAIEFDRVHRLLAYVGGRDRMSRAGAIDYVLSLQRSAENALGMWRDGRKVARALCPLVNTDVPHFPPGVTAYPYISGEAERLARCLQVTEMRWYNVFEGEHMLKALGRLQGAVLGAGDAEVAAADLAKAAELDLFGLSTHQIFYLQMQGQSNGRHLSRNLWLEGTNAHELTGGVAALAVSAVLNGEVALGLNFAGEALPIKIFEQLRRSSAVTGYGFAESELEASTEEGEL